MAARQDKDQSEQRINELEDEINNYRVYYRYICICILILASKLFKASEFGVFLTKTV